MLLLGLFAIFWLLSLWAIAKKSFMEISQGAGLRSSELYLRFQYKVGVGLQAAQRCSRSVSSNAV